jgi:hypothetical protein
MNKPLLRERDFDPYTSTSESVSVRRIIVKISHLAESRLGAEVLKAREPLPAPFDAKQNLRALRGEASDPRHFDADLLSLAEAAVSRQQVITRDELTSRVEILASDLSKIFD